jgi:hypothetical protein
MDDELNLTTESLQNFYEPEFKIFRHSPFRDFYCSPGVKYVEEAGRSNWLINAIASIALLDASHGGLSHLPFQVWKFQRHTNDTGIFSGKLTCCSDDGYALKQEYEQDFWVTDFPLEAIEFMLFRKREGGFNDGRPFCHLILPQES